MKRYLVILAVVSILLTGAYQAAFADILPLDGSWVVLDENMSAGDFFTGAGVLSAPWTFTGPATFRITDLFVVSDQFSVYDNNILVFTTPAVSDWSAYTSDPYDSPPFTSDPDTAWLSAYFSKASYVFGAGDHSITIQDIHIPPQADGSDFPDGTVAFSAKAVPLPSALLLFAPGLGLLGLWRRRSS
jgi:hypothetical protein